MISEWFSTNKKTLVAGVGLVFILGAGAQALVSFQDKKDDALAATDHLEMACVAATYHLLGVSPSEYKGEYFSATSDTEAKVNVHGKENICHEVQVHRDGELIKVDGATSFITELSGEDTAYVYTGYLARFGSFWEKPRKTKVVIVAGLEDNRMLTISQSFDPHAPTIDTMFYTGSAE